MRTFHRRTLALLLHPPVLSVLLLIVIVRAVHLGRLADERSYLYDLTLPALYGGGGVTMVSWARIQIGVFQLDSGFVVRESGWDEAPHEELVVVGEWSLMQQSTKSGLWAPTHEHQFLTGFYIPDDPSITPFGNSPSELAEILTLIESLLASSARYPFSLASDLEYAIIQGWSFNTNAPAHDLSRDLRIPRATIERKVLWLGYLENTATLGVLALLVLHVHRLRREKPWRKWYRKDWQCWGCGYDLRNIAEGEPCPECGTAKEDMPTHCTNRLHAQAKDNAGDAKVELTTSAAE